MDQQSAPECPSAAADMAPCMHTKLGGVPNLLIFVGQARHKGLHKICDVGIEKESDRNRVMGGHGGRPVAHHNAHAAAVSTQKNHHRQCVYLSGS